MITPPAITTVSLAVEPRAPTTVVAAGRLMLGWLQDAGLLLLLTLLFPLVVLVMGAPVALFVRLLFELTRRW